MPASRIFGNEDDILIFSRNMFENKLQAKYYFKKIKSKHIMKNQLYINVAKDNR